MAKFTILYLESKADRLRQVLMEMPEGDLNLNTPISADDLKQQTHGLLSVDLLILDCAYPGLNVFEYLGEFRKRFPRACIALSHAYQAGQDSEYYKSFQISYFLPDHFNASHVQEIFIRERSSNKLSSLKKEKVAESGSKAHILIVDDDFTLLDTLKSFLEQLGYRVDTLDEPRNALAKISENRFNMILIDLNMPEMDGIELTQQIKANHPNMFVVGMTGLGNEELINEFLSAGAFNVFRKPFDLMKLSKILDKLVVVSSKPPRRKYGNIKKIKSNPAYVLAFLTFMISLVWFVLVKSP